MSRQVMAQHPERLQAYGAPSRCNGGLPRNHEDAGPRRSLPGTQRRLRADAGPHSRGE